jgi:Undecaprenyl-phosphate galactose phosphotransferase WbaP
MEGPIDHYRSTLIIPASFDAPLAWVHPRDLGGMLGLEVKRNLSSPHSQIFKRAVDLLLVGTTAPLWGPLCALVAVLIWWEDGASPLFIQERVGKDGETIQVVKFRTMVPDAESVLQQKLQEDEDLRREWENSHKLRSDPRVTRIGTVLRRLSLDELPQLWNVLRGEMSLVGPRPLPAYHHKALTERARDLRERVRPGITGLWQIAGRSDAGTDGLDKYDPYYVRQWSLWLDAVILVRTLRTVVKGKGAY